VAGTPDINVTPSLAIAATSAAGSKRGTSCTVAPAISDAIKVAE
jgi:hypothetical protein